MSLRTRITNDQIVGSTAGSILTSGNTGVATWGTLPIRITREVPSGPINGFNTVFNLVGTPAAGSEEVFVNGVLQNVGVSNDYTIVGGTITFSVAPLSTYLILVNYSSSNYFLPGVDVDGGGI